MSLLTPWGLVWLGSIPVLLWLWRLSATQRRVRVSSLVPFEHLLKRHPRSRTRLVINILFWLQLAALISVALAMAQPVIVPPRAKRILAILDTSASMDARQRGASAFGRAKRALLTQLGRKAPTDQVLLMATAPVTALTPNPTSDALALRQAVQDVRVAHLGGNLATTARLGRALLGSEPDEIWVTTDEAAPSDLVTERVRWMPVGVPLPNAAIVGLDARGTLCAPSEAAVTATVQNFSDQPSAITLTVQQGRQALHEARKTLEPSTRQAFVLPLPAQTHGWLEVSLRAAHNVLSVDDRAWVPLPTGEAMPIVVQSATPSFTRTMSHWLDACQALQWSAEAPTSQRPYLLVTDQEARIDSAAAAVLLFAPPPPSATAAGSTTRLSYWIPAADHPISAYLAPVQAVAASLNASSAHAVSGTPVIWALVQGRKVPVVAVDEREGRPWVTMWFDPAGSEESTPAVLAFFNSVRWLLGGSQVTMTGQPLSISGMAGGAVRVRRPDGSVESVEAEGGWVRYDWTTQAGLYRVTQGSVEAQVAVNFFDPLESDTLERPSTWRLSPPATADASAAHASRATHPLVPLCLWALAVLLLLEWWWYRAKASAGIR